MTNVLGYEFYSIEESPPGFRLSVTVTPCKLSSRNNQFLRARLNFTLTCFILVPSYSAVLRTAISSFLHSSAHVWQKINVESNIHGNTTFVLKIFTYERERLLMMFIIFKQSHLDTKIT